MSKDYKIEVKPSYWQVSLYSGEYSDRRERHDFIAANSDEEAWDLFCRYWEEEKKDTPNTWGMPMCLYWNDAEKKFIPSSFKLLEFKGEIDWDYGYGDTWRVEIKNLSIIYFKK